jgi:hypothetical protein
MIFPRNAVIGNSDVLQPASVSIVFDPWSLGYILRRMQPLRFWPFIWRCIDRAATDTKNFAGWDIKTVLIGIILAALGFFIFWRIKGLPETRAEISKYFLLIAAPATLFASGLMLFNLFRAPYLIYIAEYAKAQGRVENAEEGKASAEDAMQTADAKVRALEKQLAERPASSHSQQTVAPSGQSPLFSGAEKIVLTNWLKEGHGNAIRIVTVGGTEASAISSQIQEAFGNAGWTIQNDIIGSLNITVVGGGGGGRVEVRGLYLIAVYPEGAAVRTIVSSFEQAKHPVSLNGSTVLRPRGDITLYVIFGNQER